MQSSQVTEPQHSARPSRPSSYSSRTVEQQDVGVLSYLLYRAFGPRPRPSEAHTDPHAQLQSLEKINTRTVSSRNPSKRSRRSKPKSHTRIQIQIQDPLDTQTSAPPRMRQPFDYFLVLDVEATCREGCDLNWCNEIIELPVVLLAWKDKGQDGRASQLTVVDEFHTFIRPTFRPVLSDFCKALTGISQEAVDAAPVFADAIAQLRAWLVNHGLIHERTDKPLRRFVWCTDGPFDIRDFVVKQCFISQVQFPDWFRTDIMDVRRVVSNWAQAPENQRYPKTASAAALLSDSFHKPPLHFRRRSLNIASQLQALSLAPFQGRQHSGIDFSLHSFFLPSTLLCFWANVLIHIALCFSQDSRNIARIVTELGRIGIRLERNLSIDPGRKWYWMGSRPGEICEDYL